MNELKVFEKEGMKLEVWMNDGKEFFPAKEVAEILGYINPLKAIRDHCKDKGCTNRSVLTAGGTQQKKYIDEGNLYRLIAKSELPDAEKFESWIFDEVLPAIRKHGGYLTSQKIEEALLNPDTLIQLATTLKEERAKRLEAEKTIEVNRPKVIFAEALEISDSAILIGQLAKILKQNKIEIGQNRLFEKLRTDGYLCKAGENYNMPTQRSMEMKLFEVKTTTINNPDGSVRVTKTPKVTGKGQQYFINKFLDKAM